MKIDVRTTSDFKIKYQSSIIRGKSRTPKASKIEPLAVIVNGCLLSTIVPNKLYLRCSRALLNHCDKEIYVGCCRKSIKRKPLKIFDIKGHKIKESTQVYKAKQLDRYMFKVNYENSTIRYSKTFI